MPAFVIADIDVHDPDRYADYKVGSPGSIAEFGGRFVARGGAVEALEGDWAPARLVVIEFPDSDSARTAGTHPTATRRSRRSVTRPRQGRFVLVDGVKD